MSDPLLRAMRYALLERLARDGARTYSELCMLAPFLLMLALDRTEVAHALDSARRHRLVEPLDPSVRDPAQIEWGLTELGRKEARSPYASLFERLSQSLQVLIVGTTVLIGLVGAATNLDFDLETLEATTAAFLLFGALIAAQLVIAAMNDRRHRVSRARIARDWPRLAMQRPRMHRHHTTKRWLIWPGIAGLGVAEVLLAVDPEPETLPGVAIGLGIALFAITQTMLLVRATLAHREAIGAMQAQLDANDASAARRSARQAPPQRVSSPA
jgi:hypothetical protein